MGIAAAVIGAGALSAGATAFGASQAAGAQESAAKRATAVQQQEFNTQQQVLSPYTSSGMTSDAMLQLLTGQIPGTPSSAFSGLPGGVSLTTALNPSVSTLENLPGYQFQLAQGLQATQNGFAAQGLGTSGAALKGAANYAEGLAQSNWQNYINTGMSQQQQIFNMLFGQTQLGENAAAGVGSGALQTGQSIGQNITGAANAGAGAILAGTSGITQNLNPLNIALLSNLLGGGGANAGVNLSSAGLFGFLPA